MFRLTGHSVLFIVVVFVLFVYTPVAGQTTEPGSEAPSSLIVLPEDSLYTPYMASLRFPEFRFGQVMVTDANINNTGDMRWDLRAGRSVPLLRFGGWPRWQFAGFGGFKALFDSENSTDNIAWDGVFGMSLAAQMGPNHAFRLQYQHLSAHIGDELIERTGRTRIDYTRQEVALGYSNTAMSDIRTYVEGGWAVETDNNDLQEPGRFQAGLEYNLPHSRYGDQTHLEMGPFLAADLESTEERDWQIDTTIQGGLYGLRKDHLLRIGVEYHNGQVPYGEFFQTDETYLGAFIWSNIF